METLQQLFGRRVRQLRRRAGESQEGFAHRLDMGRSYVGRVERGEVNVSLVNVARIAAGLGVEPIELFRFTKLPGR